VNAFLEVVTWVALGVGAIAVGVFLVARRR
jgi:hypothetical protein